MRAFDLACETPWAITEPALQTMLEIAADHGTLSREEMAARIEAVEARLGRPLDHTHDVTHRDGVATIPVDGPLFRHANLFTQMSGATSIQTLATDLRAALDDPAISAIILQIDSPGGEVNGTSEFADMVYAARDQKPIIAYIADMGASAAYWIASAADEVVIADTAKVGSIGVVAAMRDPKSAGSRSIEFVSSQSPNKRPDPTTEKGRAQIQGMVDDLAAVFVQTVARNRGVSAEDVLRDFGQGGVFVGKAAVAAGLADRVGSYESVLAELASRAQRGIAMPRTRAAAAAEDSAAEMSAAEQEAPGVQTPATEETTTMAEQTTTAQTERMAELEARMAALEQERDAAKQESAQLAQTAAQAEQRAAEAAERTAALERDARRSELRATAQGWHGDTERHVAFMETLDAEGLAFYVETQSATAAQLKDSDLFKAAGVSGADPNGDGSARAQIDARVKALQAEEKLDYATAIQRVSAQDPALYERYRAEVGGK